MFRLGRKSKDTEAGLFPKVIARTVKNKPKERQVPIVITPKDVTSRLKGLSTDKQVKKPILIDASWHMPNLDPPRNAFAEYRSLRIPGAGFWDHDVIADKSVALPHMLPTKGQFEAAAAALAITPDDHVVFYDSYGVFSAPRAAWVFKTFGHRLVSVLNGGLPRWKAEGYPLDTSETPKSYDPSQPLSEDQLRPFLSELMYAEQTKTELTYDPTEVKALFTKYRAKRRNETLLVQYPQIAKNIKKTPGDFVLDARPSGRWHGTEPEPRQGLSSGHMPGSLSVPFMTVLSPPSETDPPYRTVRGEEDIERIMISLFEREHWHKSKHQGGRKIINTCGSGMTAAVLWLALQRVGVKSAIYDESWTGYASREDAVIEKTAGVQ